MHVKRQVTTYDFGKPYISRGKEIGHSFCRFSSPHRKVPPVMQNFTTSNVAKEMLNTDQ